MHEAFAATLEHYVSYSSTGRPVHTWRLPATPSFKSHVVQVGN
jgi:hypothetical protein